MRSLWSRIEKARRRNQPHDRNLARFKRELAASVAAKRERAEAAPPIVYPPELPVSGEKDRIKGLIAANQVVVLCGETGSGKSTQLPKILMELGFGADGVIAHTQPRRLAARTLAQRVASELSVPVGGAVGYSVRFEDRTGPDTRIRYLTDGLLLAELARDPDLLACDAGIVDEAHERSLNIDFLLGYLKRLLPRRPDLKLVVTSATIDTARFAAHFPDENGEPAPVIEVSGRTYPVTIEYRPPEDDSPAAAERALLGAFDEAVRGSGDVLVFLPTERAIGDAAKLLRGHTQNRSFPGGSVEVLPLYARLSNAEQQRVFAPSGGGRRVVLATNVAESSVTVPRITSVIDLGLARISRYSARARMQRLPIEPVSQASCNQRAGRCGRVAPGTCYRLYSGEDFEDRPAFEAPEVLRTSLASVILTMASMGLGDPADFPFLEPPRPAAIREGRKTLHELGAADRDGALTALGRRMAALPVDPRVARMVFAGEERGCLPEVLVIAAALEAQDPRLRPADMAQAADQAHRPFVHPRSDFLTLLLLWDGIHREKELLSGGAFKRWCSRAFLSHPKVREWSELHRQLVDTARGAGLRPKRRKPGPEEVEKLADPIHRALLAGLLSNVAFREDAQAYKAAGAESGERELFLWPGSALAKAKPRWIVAAEVVSTTRQYARTCAQIDPRWIEGLAGDLVTQTHANPRWEREAGGVFVDEKVSFRGLVLVPKRRVKLAHVDPQQARQVFLHEALVGGDVEALKPPFWEHNQRLQAEIEEEQARLRRVDLLADAKRRYRFYDERLPAEVVGVPELNRWWEGAPEAERQRLFMAPADLREAEVESDPGRPSTITTGGLVLPVRYVHDAGAEDDGATLEVPLAVLGRVEADRLDWGLPGQLEERLTAVIRSLPKPIRKTLAPAPDSARRAAGRIAFGEGDFRSAAAEALGWVRGERFDPALIDLRAIDRHLRLNVAVLDEGGGRLAQSRDLASLRARFSDKAGRATAKLADEKWTRDGLTAWSFGDLPESVEVRHGGAALRAFPTLLDRGEAVSLRAVETEAEAAAAFPGGVLRLAQLGVAKDLAKRVAAAHAAQKLAMFGVTMPGGADALRRDVAGAAARRVFLPLIDAHPPRSEAAFDALVEAGRGDLTAAAGEVTAEALTALEQGHALRLELDRLAQKPPPGWAPALRQSREQLDDLLRPGFVGHTPADRLAHLGRFLAASRERLAALARGKLARDTPAAAAFDRRMQPLRARLSEAGAAEQFEAQPELSAYRWMLEEWRVSLFAPHLGTSQPVSDKRLEKQASKADREARGG